MTEWVLKKIGSRYILMMMLATRLVGFTGGFLTIYYMNLTMHMPLHMRQHWIVSAAISIVAAVIFTVLLALWKTRTLRFVMARLHRGESVDDGRARKAGCEAVTFTSRHHFHEAIVVPLVTVLPVCLFMWFVEKAPFSVLKQISTAAFLGISVSLMCTYFVIERCMSTVVRSLLLKGIPVEFESMPSGRLHVRMMLSFSLIIMVTATMIGSLASQRAMDIIRNPEQQADAVANLKEHTIYISVVAVVVGILYSAMLSSSIASRTGHLVEAMKRVQQGSLSERVEPTGTDEIDILARQFNTMVERLDKDAQIIRDLNANLEQKVKQRTQELSESKKDLQESLQKLQEYDQLKTDFFSNVSHELRTPLTMILSPVERILETESHHLSPEVISRLETTRINGHRLLKLINQLLDFSKLEAGHGSVHRSAVDVNAMIQKMTDAAKPLAEQLGLELHLDLDPAVPLISADEEKLDTIISNLLSNALKFTPSGGAIRMETTWDSEHLQVSVTDTGLGIAPENHLRVFERFVQVDGSSSRERPGTGLGMALVKEFIELHGGQIFLESELGKGSRFWFKLPLENVSVTGDHPSEEAEARQKSVSETEHYQRFADLMVCNIDRPPHKQVAGIVPLYAPTVLVVDDTPEVRSMVGELLAEQYHVLFAKDGEEGIEKALQNNPDLILSDVMMPRVDGYEFCRRMKEDPATAGIPFVMLTAKADLSMKIAGLDCGADDYLVKPFDKEELRARVRSLLKLRHLHREIDERNRKLETTLTELREAQSQLIHSEKMNSLGQLVAGIAHEINNAINAVYNGIQPLRKKTHRVEDLIANLSIDTGTDGKNDVCDEIQCHLRKISQLAEIVEHGATRTARIVSDLKTFSHPGSEQSETFNLHESLDVCLNLLSSQFKHRVQIRRDYRADGLIHAPCGELNQVFMNLLNNSLQAISDEGEITISTHNEEDRISISVRDTGTGIPEDVRSRIFDPFFTTKEPGVGTGLGLSISYGIINRLGGTIECYSQVGEGTEFVVTLPNDTQKKKDTGDELECVLTTSSSSGGEMR